MSHTCQWLWLYKEGLLNLVLVYRLVTSMVVVVRKGLNKAGSVRPSQDETVLNVNCIHKHYICAKDLGKLSYA